MNNTLAFRALLGVVLTLCVALTSGLPTSGKPNFSSLVVFGDSYSDDGNVFRLSNGTWPLPIFYKGGFSDGKLWNNYLADKLDIPMINYAYGGATADNALVQGRTGPTGKLPVPGLLQQVESYSTLPPSQTDRRNILAATWLLGNDYPGSNFTASPSAVIAHTALSWVKLYEIGIRKFLIPNIPSLSKMPYWASSTPELLAKLLDIKKEHNKELDLAIKKFQQDSKDVTIYTFDVDQFYTYYQEKLAKAAGTEDFTGVCVDLFASTPTVCPNPKKFFFFDAFHLETTVYEALATEILGSFKE